MKCIFSIMDNDNGLYIADEMNEWLKPQFDVIEVHHNGKEFEWPGIKATADLSIQTNEPVLYIHTKGAAHGNQAQSPIRNWWKKELTHNIGAYVEALKTHDVVCPISGKENHTWFNMFIAKPNAWKAIYKELLEPKLDNRYFYEDMWINTDIDVYGVLCNDIDHYNVTNIWKFVK